MAVNTAGMRELKAQLPKYLLQVKADREIAAPLKGLDRIEEHLAK